MKHPEDRIIEELDGRLAPEHRGGLERHLAECARCRNARDEYRDLLAGLRGAALPGDGTERPGFWEDLARGIEQRIAGETEAASVADRTAPAALVDLRERARFRNGWTGVGGGLLAAGVSVVLLVSLYLTLPRTAAAPQAFTTPASDQRPGPGVVPRDVLQESDELLALAAEIAVGEEGDGDLGSLAALAAGRDPITQLADAEEELGGLTAEELAELLATLESRT
ncbi:MAG: zf-HC2 domain-containing protein [Gemmatimonadetes bacterium]|nr:zf-HC2 domain-containing protein [Gemmatimonadota bacterium]